MIETLAVELRSEIADALSRRLEADDRDGRARLTLDDQRQLGRSLIADALERLATKALADGREPLGIDEEDELSQLVEDAVFGLGPLQRLLDDPEIENVNANGCDVVWVRRADGTQERGPALAADDNALIELIRTAAARFGQNEKRFDLSSPQLNLRLPDGSRLFAVMSVAHRPSLSIRRHRLMDVTLADLRQKDTLTPELEHFLGACVRARRNIIICGGTNVGKTTLLRALASEMDPHERLVTIEDSLELGLNENPDRHHDVVAMEVREDNVEGEGGIGLAQLVRMALRMSPDRVIVGEVRGDEVVPMMNAMSQGNNGSICTLHADSSRGAFSKLTTYAIQSKERLAPEATNLLVANSIDFIVFIDRDPRTKTRVVSSIREVVDAEGYLVQSNEIFAPGPGRLGIPTGVTLREETLNALIDAGFDPTILLGQVA